MNKNDYINELDSITASNELKNAIKASANSPKKKHSAKRFIAIAACIAVVFVCTFGFLGNAFNASKSDSFEEMEMQMDSSNYANGSKLYTDDGIADSDSKNQSIASNRKIIKNASVVIQTKDYSAFMTEVNKSVSLYGGYSEQCYEYNSDDSSSRSASVTFRIPADKLEEFLAQLDKLGSVQSKEITKSDITDSYIDTQSRITALETEESALLALLKKSESLQDIISVQDRLTTVRGELESYKATLKSYDSQIESSTVHINVSETQRVIKSDDSFLSQIKAKFMQSIYDLGQFFTAFAINLIGNLPYIIIIAVVAVIVIIIIKKRKNK